MELQLFAIAISVVALVISGLTWFLTSFGLGPLIEVQLLKVVNVWSPVAQVHFRISLINRRKHIVYFQRIRVAIPSFIPRSVNHLTWDNEVRSKSVGFGEVSLEGVFALAPGEIRRIEIDVLLRNPDHERDWPAAVQSGIPNPWRRLKPTAYAWVLEYSPLQRKREISSVE